MIRLIEIEFAVPVEITEEEMKMLDGFVQAVARRHEPEGHVHWASGCGSKPNWSQMDAMFLGKKVDQSAPSHGEPTFDDSVLHFETTCRQRYPGEGR
jgi:hypothetical protein